MIYLDQQGRIIEAGKGRKPRRKMKPDLFATFPGKFGATAIKKDHYKNGIYWTGVLDPFRDNKKIEKIHKTLGTKWKVWQKGTLKDNFILTEQKRNTSRLRKLSEITNDLFKGARYYKKKESRKNIQVMDWNFSGLQHYYVSQIPLMPNVEYAHLSIPDYNYKIILNSKTESPVNGDELINDTELLLYMLFEPEPKIGARWGMVVPLTYHDFRIKRTEENDNIGSFFIIRYLTDMTDVTQYNMSEFTDSFSKGIKTAYNAYVRHYGGGK